MKSWNVAKMFSLALVFIGGPIVGRAAGPELTLIPQSDTRASQIEGENVRHVYMGQDAAGRDQLGVLNDGGLVSSPVAGSGEILTDGYENTTDQMGTLGEPME